MTKTVITVDGMSCEHCVNAVTKAVGALPGVSGAAVSLADKTATVEYDPSAVTIEDIKAAIEDQGYEVVA